MTALLPESFAPPGCALDGPGLLTTTEPAAVPMSGVNLGEAMMGVRGTKGSRVVWVVRDERGAADNEGFVMLIAVAWLTLSDGPAAKRCVDCAREVVAFVTFCSALSSLFAIGRRSRSDRDDLGEMEPEKDADDGGIVAGEGALRTSMYATLNECLPTNGSSVSMGAQ